MKYLGLIFIISVMFGCSTINKRKIDEKNSAVIRYVNIRLIYDTLIKKDGEYRDIKYAREALIKRIKAIEESLFLSKGKIRMKLGEYNNKKKELIELDRKITFVKSRILNRINRAIKAVADEIGADFVLSIGDEVIYAKKKYDITEEVIRIIVKMEHRTSPVSR